MNQRQLRSPINKLPSGRYQVTFRDSERKLTRRSFDKHSEAQQFLDETRQAVRNHTYISPAKVPTVKEAATEWLEAKKVTKSRHGGLRKENTIKYWQQHIDGYIVPELGNNKLNSLTLAFVEAI